MLHVKRKQPFQGIIIVKIYGRAQKDDAELEILDEVNLVTEPSTLRELASFLYRCADAIDEQDENWEHELFESNEIVNTQFVVYNPNLVNA